MNRFTPKLLAGCIALVFTLGMAAGTARAQSEPSTTAPSTQPSRPVRFVVTFPKEALAEPFSGRVVVYLSARMEQPRFERNWFRPEPKFSVMVKNVQPGEQIVIESANAVGFPST